MQSRAFRRFSAAAGLVTACQASSIRRFLPSPSAALLSSVSARLVSTSSSNRLSAARLVCTFPTRAVLTGASALDQCRARVRARSRRRSDTRNYRTTGLQSIELAVTTQCGHRRQRKADIHRFSIVVCALEGACVSARSEAVTDRHIGADAPDRGRRRMPIPSVAPVLRAQTCPVAQ